MKEGKTKRRDLIKNFAIVFLSVLLALTFFSNTILNYSLPEVATVYVQAGTITTRVRGTGPIEASDPYNVIAGEDRTISSVAVKVGTEVAKGDVIYYLEESESEQVKRAEAELNDMELDFMKRLLSGDIRSSVINKVDAGTFASYADLRDRLIASQTGEKAAENQVEALQRNVHDMQRRLVSLGVPSGDQVALKDQLVLKVEEMEDYVFLAVNGILAAYEEVPLESAGAALSEARTKVILTMVYAAERITKEQYEASFKAMDSVLKQYNESVTALNAAIREAENNLIVAQQALRDAEERFGRVSESRIDIIADIQAELTFNNLVEQIEAKRKEIEDLKEKSTGASITAPVAGIITSLSYVAGETTQMGNAVAVIQVAGKGFTVSFTVSNEQASRVKVGDPAEVQGNWWWNDIAVTLTGIRPNANNPGQSKDLLFTVTGTDIQVGQQLTISVGSRSVNYDLTVPNSAIREDSNSKFILILETRITPISNRIYATRVDVEVIAEDEYNSAINAPLYGWGEYVITTATKPVSAGQQVRKAN